MSFKGGMVNGSLAAFYGALSFIPLFLAMNQHHTMQTVSYALGGLGIILAVFWIATREVMGIPILLVGFVFLAAGARSEHVALQISCAALGVVAFVLGVMMLTRAQSTRGPGM